MKKSFLIIYICILAVLSGCGKSGTIFTAYRDTARLKVIQTVGVDPGPRLTVTSGSSGDDDDSVLLSAEAGSIGECMEHLQDYATDSELFYSHLQYILLSDELATESIDPVLDYIERSVDIRMKTSMFLVRGSADDLMTGAGSGNYDISRVLSSLMADVDSRGRTRVFSCAETARSIARCGGALICALQPCEREGAVFSEEDSGLTAVPDGFGVLKGGRLMGFVDAERTAAVCILVGNPGSDLMTIECGGFGSTVQLCGSDVEFVPVYENGRIAAVDVKIDISALLTETERPEDAGTPEFLDELGNALSDRIRSDVEAVLGLYGEYGCDFLCLGPQLRAKSPGDFDRCRWYENPDAHFRVTVNGEIVRTYESGG